MAQYLEEYGKRFWDYGLLEPTSYGREVEHEMSQWNQDPNWLAAHSQCAVDLFNLEQLQIHNDALAAVRSDHALQIFVDGKAGMGKTILVNAICEKVRSMGRILLPTAITAFATQHYAKG
jgi:RecG-like helicase